MKSVPEFKNINEYIALQQGEHQLNLEMIRQTVKATVPEAVETISYQMPAFKYHGMLCYFAVFKDHYSLFVEPKIKESFSKQLAAYSCTKSAIHFPFNQPIPVELISEIVRFTALINLEKAESKKSKRKGKTTKAH